jgi:Domain of unknown function (DUF4157)
VRRVVSHFTFTLLACLGFTGTVFAQAPASKPPATTSLHPLMVQSLAPLLAGSIVSARDTARAEGVELMPPAIRTALTGYVPEEILARVRWRAGGDVLSLPPYIIQFGDVPAMTLDDIIVFEDRGTALTDPKLWAHELKHVMQFAEWGIDGFATRYLTDYEAVEAEAAEFRWQFMRQAGLVPDPQPAAK